jgi:hypothetical protein
VVSLFGIQTVWNKKVPVPQPVWYRNKETQSGIGMFRYQNDMLEAGMPMASYDLKEHRRKILLTRI